MKRVVVLGGNGFFGGLIVEKLLSTPTEQLKGVGDAELLNAYSEALTRLFALNAQPDASAPDRPARNVEPFTRRTR